ncbi:TPA: Bor/Iss family lipoprotein [Serratia fonticola]
MLKKHLLTTILLPFFLVGCASKKVIFDSNEQNNETSIKTEASLYYFFDFIGRDQILYSSKICPYGVYSIENEKTFIDSLIGILTLGIVTPRTITFKCLTKDNKHD